MNGVSVYYQHPSQKGIAIGLNTAASTTQDMHEIRSVCGCLYDKVIREHTTVCEYFRLN